MEPSKPLISLSAAHECVARLTGQNLALVTTRAGADQDGLLAD